MESLLGTLETDEDWEGGIIQNREDEEEIEPSDRQHEKLIQAITTLGGKKKKTSSTQRHESVQVASEFHSSGGDSGKVKLNELVNALNKTTSHKQLQKNLDNVGTGKTSQPVAPPLPKRQLQQIERQVAYEKTSDELKIWDPVVQSNRKNEQLHFPLQQADVKLITADKFVKRFQPRTPLEMEVAALLHGSDNVLRQNHVLTKAEERALRAMSIEEAKERRAELQKHRALLYYRASKAKRVKKIKSKSYHRILRKERMKEEKRTIEELQEKDPEAYLDKLQQMDRTRIQERMSLKHRGGSKFMKKQAIYAKYDNVARQSVQDMIKKNKELLEKVVHSDEEEVFSEIDETEINDSKPDSLNKNPWMSVGIKKKNVKSLVPQVIVTAKSEEMLMNDEAELETDIGSSLHQKNIDISESVVESGEEMIKGESYDDINEELLTSIATDIGSDVSKAKTSIQEMGIVDEQGAKSKKGRKSKQEKNTDKKVIKNKKGKQVTESKQEENIATNEKPIKESNLDKNVNKQVKKGKKEKQNDTLKESVVDVKTVIAQTDDMESGKKNKRKRKKRQGEVPTDTEKPQKKLKETDDEKLKAEDYESIDNIFNDAIKQRTDEMRVKKDKLNKQREESKNLKRKQIDRDKERNENQQNKRKKLRKGKRDESDSESLSDTSSEEEEEITTEEQIVPSLVRKNQYEDFAIESTSGDANKTVGKKQKPIAVKKHESEKAVQLDPNKFFTVNSSINENMSHGLVEDESDDQDDSEKRMTIAEAFASDDVIEEFIQEKKNTIDSDRPADIDLYLPGWGSWSGTGIKPAKKKRNKFVIKAPKVIPRKDRHLGNVIISEANDKKISKHQVNQLPFPFTNVHDFQSSLRQPIGKTWNPETAYKALTKPKLTTAMGTVIEPIDKSEIFKDKKKNSQGEVVLSNEEKQKTTKKKWKNKKKQK